MPDIIIRTKAGKTLKEAALEIFQFFKRNNILEDGTNRGNIEDMLGQLMSPPVKSKTTPPINRWYVRIRLDPEDVPVVTNALPLSTTVELVGWDMDYEYDPELFVGRFW